LLAGLLRSLAGRLAFLRRCARFYRICGASGAKLLDDGEYGHVIAGHFNDKALKIEQLTTTARPIRVTLRANVAAAANRAPGTVQ